jgi:hypothetical protein
VNGRPLKGDAEVVGGILGMPVAAAAEATGRTAARGPDGELYVGGTRVPAVLVGGVPYIQLTKVCDVFGAYVYWNQEARSIELTYPFSVKDGSD